MKNIENTKATKLPALSKHHKEKHELGKEVHEN